LEVDLKYEAKLAGGRAEFWCFEKELNLRLVHETFQHVEPARKHRGDQGFRSLRTHACAAELQMIIAFPVQYNMHDYVGCTVAAGESLRRLSDYRLQFSNIQVHVKDTSPNPSNSLPSDPQLQAHDADPFVKMATSDLMQMKTNESHPMP
jgi:hypothetical protein